MRRAFAENRERKQDIQTDAKKFHPGKNPLEREESIDVIQPANSNEHKQLLKMIRRMIKNTRDPKQKAALEFKLVETQTGELKGIIHQEFLRDFWAWMLGRGKEEDHKKTPWYRQSLANDDEVSAYCDAFVTKMHEYRVQLARLKMRMPLGIKQIYLFFKYIVRGEELDNTAFLDDWKIFQQEFYKGRELGNEERNKDPLPANPLYFNGEHGAHEMAPYGDARKMIADEREKKEQSANDKLLEAPDRDSDSEGGGFRDDDEEESSDIDYEEVFNQTSSEVDSMMEARGVIDARPAPPADAPPVTPVVVPPAAQGPFETGNVDIHAERANRRVRDLEDEIKASNDRIEDIRKRYKEMEKEKNETEAVEREKRAEARNLRREKEELKEKLETEKSMREMEKGLLQQQAEMRAQRDRAYAEAEKGRNQEEFAESARRDMDRLTENLQRGHVKDLEAYQKEVSELKQKLDTVSKREKNMLSQHQKLKMSLQGQRAQFSILIADAAQRNHGSYELGYQRAREEMRIQAELESQALAELRAEMEAEFNAPIEEKAVVPPDEQPVVFEAVAEPVAPVAVPPVAEPDRAEPVVSDVLKENLVHLNPEMAEEVIEQVEKSEVSEKRGLESETEVQEHVQIGKKVAKVVPQFEKEVEKAEEKLKKANKKERITKKKVGSKALAAEEKARKASRARNEREFGRFLPNQELQQEAVEDASTVEQEAERGVKNSKRNLEEVNAESKGIRKEVQKSVKAAKKDALKVIEADQQERQLEMIADDIQREEHAELKQQKVQMEQKAIYLAEQRKAAELAQAKARLMQEEVEKQKAAQQKERQTLKEKNEERERQREEVQKEQENYQKRRVAIEARQARAEPDKEVPAEPVSDPIPVAVPVRRRLREETEEDVRIRKPVLDLLKDRKKSPLEEANDVMEAESDEMPPLEIHDPENDVEGQVRADAEKIREDRLREEAQKEYYRQQEEEEDRQQAAIAQVMMEADLRAQQAASEQELHRQEEEELQSRLQNIAPAESVRERRKRVTAADLAGIEAAKLLSKGVEKRPRPEKYQSDKGESKKSTPAKLMKAYQAAPMGGNTAGRQKTAAMPGRFQSEPDRERNAVTRAETEMIGAPLLEGLAEKEKVGKKKEAAKPEEMEKEKETNSQAEKEVYDGWKEAIQSGETSKELLGEIEAAAKELGLDVDLSRKPDEDDQDYAIRVNAAINKIRRKRGLKGKRIRFEVEEEGETDSQKKSQLNHN